MQKVDYYTIVTAESGGIAIGGDADLHAHIKIVMRRACSSCGLLRLDEDEEVCTTCTRDLNARLGAALALWSAILIAAMTPTVQRWFGLSLLDSALLSGVLYIFGVGLAHHAYGHLCVWLGQFGSSNTEGRS